MDKDYLLQKWLRNELTDEEHEAFSKLEDADFYNEIITSAKAFKASNFSKVDSFEVFKAKALEAQNKKPVYKLNARKYLMRIASVLVIAFGIYFLFVFNPNTQIETLASEKTTIELPDASLVSLNAYSTISFNKKDWKENRLVELDGEAYFKVSKGGQFDVKTQEGLVTVVGTEFNVKQRSNYFEVVCFEGKVKVVSDTISRLLQAGDSYRILNNMFTETTTTSIKPKWTENISEFVSVPFKEVLAELERQYNIEVTFKDVNVNRIFTGGFMHNDLESALLSITQPMDMTFELSSDNLVVIHAKKN